MFVDNGSDVFAEMKGEPSGNYGTNDVAQHRNP